MGGGRDVRGPSDDTQVRFPLPRRLSGLSYCDEQLLRRWLDQDKGAITELHVSIPLGPEPDKPFAGCSEAIHRAMSYSHAYKLDAAALDFRGWTLIECKPRARHRALGQILSYGYWWQHHNGLGRPGRLLVVTTEVTDEVLAVYRRYGIQVEQMGDVEGTGDRFY